MEERSYSGSMMELHLLTLAAYPFLFTLATASANLHERKTRVHTYVALINETVVVGAHLENRLKVTKLTFQLFLCSIMLQVFPAPL